MRFVIPATTTAFRHVLTLSLSSHLFRFSKQICGQLSGTIHFPSIRTGPPFFPRNQTLRSRHSNKGHKSLDKMQTTFYTAHLRDFLLRSRMIYSAQKIRRKQSQPAPTFRNDWVTLPFTICWEPTQSAMPNDPTCNGCTKAGRTLTSRILVMEALGAEVVELVPSGPGEEVDVPVLMVVRASSLREMIQKMLLIQIGKRIGRTERHLSEMGASLLVRLERDSSSPLLPTLLRLWQLASRSALPLATPPDCCWLLLCSWTLRSSHCCFTWSWTRRFSSATFFRSYSNTWAPCWTRIICRLRSISIKVAVALRPWSSTLTRARFFPAIRSIRSRSSREWPKWRNSASFCSISVPLCNKQKTDFYVSVYKNAKEQIGHVKNFKATHTTTTRKGGGNHESLDSVVAREIAERKKNWHKRQTFHFSWLGTTKRHHPRSDVMKSCLHFKNWPWNDTQTITTTTTTRELI